MCSTNDEAFGAPSIKPIIPTRGIPKVILSRSSAPSGSTIILVGGDKGTANDAAFARNGKCEHRTCDWLERVTKMAAIGLMFAELEESRAEDSIAISGLEFSFTHALDILANTSKYLVVVLNPTVK